MRKRLILSIIIEIILIVVFSSSNIVRNTRYNVLVEYFPYNQPLTLSCSESVGKDGEVRCLETGDIIIPTAVSDSEVLFHLDGDYNRYTLPISSFVEQDQLNKAYNEGRSNIQNSNMREYKRCILQGLICGLFFGIITFIVFRSSLTERYKLTILYSLVLGTIVITLFYLYLALSIR